MKTDIAGWDGRVNAAVTIKNAKRPARLRVGWSGPSMALTPALVRCGASLRLSEFAPGEFVEPGGCLPSRHHQKCKTPHEGAFCIFGGEGGRLG